MKFCIPVGFKARFRVEMTAIINTITLATVIIKILDKLKVRPINSTIGASCSNSYHLSSTLLILEIDSLIYHNDKTAIIPKLKNKEKNSTRKRRAAHKAVMHGHLAMRQSFSFFDNIGQAHRTPDKFQAFSLAGCNGIQAVEKKPCGV
jgi:hypothetical protein